MPVQSADFIRRKPLQARSEATLAAIFEATARILNAKGSAGLNTNAIAELAGISIGTLYQYFPNKDSILIALARQELAKTQQAVVESFRGEPNREAGHGIEPIDAVEPVRATVRTLLTAFSGRRRTRKLLLEAMIAYGLSEELSRPVEAVMKNLAEHMHRNGPEGGCSLSELRLFVLTRAVVGLIRAAVMEESKWLDDPCLEDEMVHLIRGYLGLPYGA